MSINSDPNSAQHSALSQLCCMHSCVHAVSTVTRSRARRAHCGAHQALCRGTPWLPQPSSPIATRGQSFSIATAKSMSRQRTLRNLSQQRNLYRNKEIFVATKKLLEFCRDRQFFVATEPICRAHTRVLVVRVVRLSRTPVSSLYRIAYQIRRSKYDPYI